MYKSMRGFYLTLPMAAMACMIMGATSEAATITILSNDFEAAWTASNTPAALFPAGGAWTKQICSNNTQWIQATNGINGNPARKRTNAWLNAGTGTDKNFARFGAGSYGNMTRLITPPLNLSGMNSATMTFWHIQVPWPADQDYLRIRMRTNAVPTQTGTSFGAGWTTLAFYSAGQTNWVERSLTLSNVSETVYIAFEGIGEYAYGTCIDDVLVVGDSNTSPAVSYEITNLVQDFEQAWTASNTPAAQFPAGGAWTKQICSNNTDWIQATNGINGNPPRKRVAAWTNSTTGTDKNFARFGAGSYGNMTRLITPPLNLSGMNGATMTFWHVQMPWSADQDYLRVRMRTNAPPTQTGTSFGLGWTTLAFYSAGQTNWVERTLALSNLSETVYIAFEGIGEYGYGTCIDDVKIFSTTSAAAPVVTYVLRTNLWQDFEVAWTASNTPAVQWPAGGAWTKQICSNNTDWIRATNGINGNPGRKRVGAWTNATTGTDKNFARFGAGSYGNMTRLITPAMDLSGYLTPTLRFWHIQVPWPADQDYLRVRMRTNEPPTQVGVSFGSGWSTLAFYSTGQTNWIERTLALTNPLSSTVYIAFEGIGEYAYGTCIDDVSILSIVVQAAAVTLAEFRAYEQDGQVKICWVTGSERETLGFNLYRQDDSGAWVQVNAALVPAEGWPNGGIGASYCLVDADAAVGRVYQYKLEEIETSGKINTYGPFSGQAREFRLSVAPGQGGPLLQWPSQAGENFDVYWTSSLLQPFELLESGVPATPPMNYYIGGSQPAPYGFYRIQAR